MAKAPVVTRVAVTARGVELLALIAASETGFLMLTQDEGAEAVSAGHAMVDTSVVAEGDTAAVRLTEAGAALLNPVAEAPKASNGFEIDADVAMPTVTRRPRESAYPFDKLEVGQSFHVAPTEEFPDPVSRLQSSVSGARLKWSVPTGEKETVTVKEYQRVGDTKAYAKGPDGKRIIAAERSEERDVLKPTRDFKVVAVDASDKRGAGARVFRTA